MKLIMEKIDTEQKFWRVRVCYTYVTGNVCVSTGSKDRNSVALYFKLFGFSFLPVVLVAVLTRQNNIYNDHLSMSVIKKHS